MHMQMSSTQIQFSPGKEEKISSLVLIKIALNLLVENLRLKNSILYKF